MRLTMPGAISPSDKKPMESTTQKLNPKRFPGGLPGAVDLSTAPMGREKVKSTG